jgi:hypothetical protein
MDNIDIAFWRKRAHAAANTKLPRPSPYNPAKRHAAIEAVRLLEKHGLPLNVTRNGKFCRLAPLLYSDEHIDLFHICRVVKAEQIQGRF